MARKQPTKAANQPTTLRERLTIEIRLGHFHDEWDDNDMTVDMIVSKLITMMGQRP